jgi:tape measure domain-containing protein
VSEKVGSISYEVELDTAKMVRGQREVDSAVNNAAQSFNRITSAVKIYAAALALVKAAQLADDMRMLASRIDVAAGSAEKGASAMREINAISLRTQTSVQANAEVFARLNQSLLQMGGTQQDTLRITELLGKAIKVSGASAVEAKSAMLQFGQALGSGKLAGDELRSLMENAPYLMRQLADGIGVPVGALKKLGEEGKLTADVVVNALSKAADKINADFQKMPQTLAAAMQAAQDSAARANESIDTLIGTSGAMTGVMTGVSDAVGMLADRLSGVTTEADKLGRNKIIEEWANGARLAMTYLIDAADTVWQALSVLGRNVAFVFQGIGTEIGGIGAQAMALARGDLEGARAIGREMKADAEKRRRELDEADRKSLNRQSAGAGIRQRMEALATGTDGSDRLDRMARSGASASKLKSTGVVDEKKGTKFDALGYLSGLSEKAADERERVTIIEEEAMRKAEELRKAGKISAEQYGTARVLIAEASARAREEIEDRANKRIADLAREANEMIAADEAKTAEQRARAREQANAILDSADPITKLRAELEQRSALLTEYAQKDQDNALLYEAAKVELARQTAEKIKEIEGKRASDQLAAQTALMQGYGGLFGSMADMAKAFGGEQSKTYKALFAVSKAFAIAESLVKIQQGVAAAAALPFPTNIPAMASVISATAGIVSTIKGVNFGGGRQYGGPVTAGSLYRVNEGKRPEMFTAANGNQYMMPTADGRVTPAGAGGGVSWNIVVNNNSPGSTATASVDEQGRTVTIAIAQIADQIRSNSGPVWSALRSSSNVAPRIS